MATKQEREEWAEQAAQDDTADTEGRVGELRLAIEASLDACERCAGTPRDCINRLGCPTCRPLARVL